MSARRTDMHRIQEVVRLHRLGQGQRAIAQQLRMGRDTIRAYQEKLKGEGLLDGCPDDLPETEALKKAIGEMPAEQPAPTPSSVERWRPKISELRKKGCGPTAIHDHLRLDELDYSGSLSAVKRVCRTCCDPSDCVMNEAGSASAAGDVPPCPLWRGRGSDKE